MTDIINAVNLQLFADGAGAGDGGAAAGAAGAAPGVTAQGDAAPVYDRAQRQRERSGMRYEKPTEQPEARPAATQAQPTTTRDAAANTPDALDTPPARPTFQQLIEGEYKDEYSKHTQGIIKARLKEAKGAEERLKKLDPALQTLAQRYGLNVSDPAGLDLDAIVKAIESDQSLYEDEAMREGIPVEQLMKQRRLEREVAQSRAMRAQQQQEAAMREQYARLQEQADAFRSKIPEFNLGSEMQNETFARMVVNGFPVENAYYATHYAEIEARQKAQSEQQMREVAQNAQQAAANAIRSNARRPTENGLNNTTPAQVRTDPSQLSLKEMRELRERARRGEEITY